MKSKQEKRTQQKSNLSELMEQAKLIPIHHGQSILVLEAAMNARHQPKKEAARDGRLLQEIKQLETSFPIRISFSQINLTRFHGLCQTEPSELEREAIILALQKLHKSYVDTFAFGVCDTSNRNFESLAQTVLKVMGSFTKLKLNFCGEVQDLKMSEFHSQLTKVIHQIRPDISFVKKLSPDVIFIRIELLSSHNEVCVVTPPQKFIHEKKIILTQEHGIICHFGEAFLKGNNRTEIMTLGLNNIKEKFLPKKPRNIYLAQTSNITIIPEEDQFEEILKIATETPGFLDACEAIILNHSRERTLNHIVNACVSAIQFASNKTNFETIFIQAKKNADLPNISKPFPIKTICEEVQKFSKKKIVFREEEEDCLILKIYIYTQDLYVTYSKHKGMGGLPISPSQNVVALLSGGIDSPVAAHLLMKRGCRVILAHFQNQSQMKDSVEDKILQLSKKLSKFQVKTLLYIIPFAELQNLIIEKIKSEERMLVYRFFMIASTIGKLNKAPFLVTGDSMSQVASQTIRNLEAIYKLSPKPILCPLIGMDKGEIIELARKIGTFEISQLPYGDCCSYFLAKHPALHLRDPEAALKILEGVPKIFDVLNLAQNAIKNSRIVEIRNESQIKIIQEMSQESQKFLEKQAELTFCPMEKPSKEEILDSPKEEMMSITDPDSLDDYQQPLTKKRNVEQHEGVKKSKIELTINESQEIYLDNAASTRLDESVVQAMLPHFLMSYGNASSSHQAGQMAALAVDQARRLVAEAIHAEPREIIFTGSGTESINLAIKGVVEFAWKDRSHTPLHIITTQIEHDAVLETFRAMEQLYGVQTTFLSVDIQGFVSIQKLANLITENTILVSIGHANNEIGTIQNIREIGQLCRQRGVLFHTDACQSFTKVPLDVQDQCVDLATLNSHKIHGPKGVGALYVRSGVKLFPQMHGGGHEYGLRGGTINVPLIAGFAQAIRLAMENSVIEQMKELAQYFYNKLKEIMGTDLQLNGPPFGELRLSNNIHLTFTRSPLQGDQLVRALSREKIYCSTGSACLNERDETMRDSHVLVAIGMPSKLAARSLRFSVSRYTTRDDINKAISILQKLLCRE